MHFAIGLFGILAAVFFVLFYTMRREYRTVLCRTRLLEVQTRLIMRVQERSLPNDPEELSVLREMHHRINSLFDLLLHVGVWSLSTVAYLTSNHTSAEPLLKRIRALSDPHARKFFEEEYHRMYGGVYEYLAQTSLPLAFVMLFRRIWERGMPEGSSLAMELVLTCARRIARNTSPDDLLKTSFALSFEEAVVFAAERLPAQ